MIDYENAGLQIVMPRGDRVSKSFVVRLSNGTPYLDTLDEIYFTVKKSYIQSRVVFQKKYSEGWIQSLGNGRYQFTILPEDTDGLPFGEYDFDIEIEKEGILKRTFCGKLILTEEVTHRVNE